MSFEINNKGYTDTCIEHHRWLNGDHIIDLPMKHLEGAISYLEFNPQIYRSECLKKLLMDEFKDRLNS